MRKTILTLIFILIGSLWLARETLFNNSVKLETEITKSIKVDKLVFSKDPVPRDKIEKVALNLHDDGGIQDDGHIQDMAEEFPCKGKWKTIVSTSYEELKQNLLDDNSISTSTNPCFMHEKEIGIFNSVEKCLEDVRTATTSELNEECEDHIHLYRARVIDRYFPDEIGFEKMGYEVLISKFSAIVADRSLEFHEYVEKSTRTVEIVSQLIELDPMIKPYYLILFRAMNMASFMNKDRISKSQWLNAISDYKNKFGVDSFYYLHKMFVYEIFDGPNEALQLAEISLVDLDHSCFSYYHVARLSWTLGETEEAEENLDYCIHKDPSHPLIKGLKKDNPKPIGEEWFFRFKDEFGEEVLFSILY